MALSEEQILANVEKGLKEVRVDDAGVVDKTPVEANKAPVADTPVVDDTPAPTTDESQNKPVVDDTVQDNIPNVPEPDKSAVKADGEPSTLSDAYRRAAIHQDWKPDEIDSFYTSNPELAEKTFAKIHETTNNLSRHWAEAGKVALEHATPAVQPPVQTVAPQSAPSTEFTGVDMNKLKQDFNDDPILDQVVAPLNEALVKLYQSFDTLKGQVNASQVVDRSDVKTEEQALIGKQTEQFFTDTNMASYKELYGKGSDWREITGNQANERMKVLTLADQIIAGASLQNEKLSNEDGMLKAHLMVSASHKEAMVRSQIKDTVSKRSNNITLQPSSAPAPVGNGQLTTNELEEKVALGLTKAFG